MASPRLTSKSTSAQPGRRSAGLALPVAPSKASKTFDSSTGSTHSGQSGIEKTAPPASLFQ
eukprot:11946598-Alexandrium_andersonii.AAC.1